MPQINLTGRSLFGNKDERFEANYENRDVDARKRQQRQEAEYTNRSIEDAAKSLHREADYLNAQITAAAKSLRQAAEYENSLRDAQYRRARSLAEYENRDRVSQDRQRKQNEDKRYRESRSLAEYENTNRNAVARSVQRNEEKRNRDARALAEYENRQRDAAAKKAKVTSAAAASAKFGTPLERYNANEANRLFDIKKRRDFDLANRPGLIGRTILGGASFFGGHRLHEAVRNTFGIGGRPGRRGGGGGGGGRGGGGGAGDEEFSEMATFGKFAEVAVIAEAAYKVAKTVAIFPQALSHFMSSINAGADPYTSLASGGARLGRSGGYAGSDLVKQFYPGTGIAPEWMSKAGMTPQEAMGVASAYGLRSGTASEIGGITKSAVSASLLPYLGGFDPARLAQSYGVYTDLTVPNAIPSSEKTGTRGSPFAGITEHNSLFSLTSDQYFHQMQRTMASADTVGIDKSRVMSNIEDLMRSQASLNMANPNVAGTSDFWWRMASSGASGARTGEMQMSTMQNTAAFANSSGFGGNVAANTMLHAYFQRNGGLPKTRTELEKQLGTSYNDLPDSQKKQFDQALDAAKNGNEAAFFGLITPWSSSPDTAMRFSQGSGLVPSGGYMESYMGAGYTGMTKEQYNAYTTGQGNREKVMSLPLQERAMEVMDRLMKDHPGMTHAQAAGIASVLAAESQLVPQNEKNPAPGTRGGFGLMQSTGSRRVRMENYMGANGKSMWDPSHNMDYLEWEVDKYYPGLISNVMKQDSAVGSSMAFEPYEGGTTKNPAGYADQFNGLAQNDLPYNRYRATAGQAQTKGAEGVADFGNFMQDTVAVPLTTFSGKIVDATKALEGFIAGMAKGTPGPYSKMSLIPQNAPGGSGTVAVP